MGVKAYDMYQGDDWVTYRPAVAQAFDTLDRMIELCQERVADGSSIPSDLVWSPQREFSDNLVALCAAAANLCDDLAADADAVLAELSPYAHNDPTQKWLGFEMQLHIKAIRTLADGEAPLAPMPTLATLDEVAALVARIRAILKRIDQ